VAQSHKAYGRVGALRLLTGCADGPGLRTCRARPARGLRLL